MKFNFKKVVPIVTGALLLGSTIGFAAGVAGQTATYPSSFADSVVVIGSASADSAAAQLIADNLGAMTTSTSSATVSDGHLVKKGSSLLNYGEDFVDIDATLDSSDLPSLLADGVYKDTKGTNDNEEDYTQKLTFTADGEQFVFTADEDNDDTMGSYLKLTDGTEAYDYTLKFTTGPKYDASTDPLLKEDFELTKLKILGDDWTITDAVASATEPDKFTLMGGAYLATMKTGDTKTINVGSSSFDVAVTVYSDKAQFVVNGESITIDAGSTDELSDGTVIGVTEISTSSKETVADQVEFYLGARKLVLEDGEKVNLNGADIKGTAVTIDTDGTNDLLQSITVTYTPEDDMWKGLGQSWSDPVFGKFKMVFAAVNKAADDKIAVSTGADTGSMELLNSAGQDLKIKFYDDDTKVFLGEKYTRANLTQGGVSTGVDGGDLLALDNAYCIGSTLEKCEGLNLLVVDSDGEARIYELSDVNEDDMQMTFTDVEGSKDYKIDYDNSSANSEDVGIIGDLEFTVAKANGTTGTNVGNVRIDFTNINNFADGKFKTKTEGVLQLSVVSPDINVKLYNKTGTSALGQFNITNDADDDMKIVMGSLTNSGEEVSGSDINVGLDNFNYGAIFTWDTKDDNRLDIVYPGDDPVSADMYVAPVSAVVSGAGIVPVVKDTELGSLKTSKDLVVVGGPAINSIAAELLGLPFPTYGSDAASGFSVDSAMIKSFEGTLTPGKVALLVAGYEAKDTSAAAKALIAEKKFGTLTTTTASTYSYAA